MPYKSIEEAAATVLANMKTGKFCGYYPLTSTPFTKEKMDASKAAGIEKKDKSIYKGKKIPITQRG